MLIVMSHYNNGHNGRDGVSNHQPHDCLLNRLFRRRSKKTLTLCVTGLCAGIHRWPVNSSHKWPIRRKMFPFDDVITWLLLFNRHLFNKKTAWVVRIWRCSLTSIGTPVLKIRRSQNRLTFHIEIPYLDCLYIEMGAWLIVPLCVCFLDIYQ